MALKRNLLFFGFSFIIFVLTTHFASAVQPSFPTNFVVSPQSACSAVLTWNEASPGASYFIYEWSTDNFLRTSVPVRLPSSGNLPFPGTGSFSSVENLLLSDTDHWFHVKACDNLNLCSSFTSPTTQIRTLFLPSAPSQPTILRATSTLFTLFFGTVQDVKISWSVNQPVSSLGGFAIYRSTDGGQFFNIGVLPYNFPRPLEWLDRSLPTNSTYTYYIKAYETSLGCNFNPALPAPTTNPNNQGVFSPISNQVIVPIAPSNFSGAPAILGPQAINLNWTDNSTNEDSFELWRTANLGCFTGGFCSPGELQIITLPSNTTSYNDPAVLPNTLYYYQVRACTNSRGCSAFPPYGAISTNLASPVLTGSIVYASSANSIGIGYISWRGVPGATRYVLERSTSTTFNPANAPILNLGTFSASSYDFYDQNVPLGLNYYYRLTASNTGQTSYSNFMSLNFDIDLVLRGVAWSGEGFVPGEFIGPGWIKFNSAREAGIPASSIPYSVQVDKNGLLSGLAWAGSNYSWLSFSQADLVGCPSSPAQILPSPPCEARLDKTTNKLSGWGKFVSPGLYQAETSWRGWVSLDNRNSGIAASPSLEKSSLSFKSVFSPFLSLLKTFNAEAITSIVYGPTYDPTTSEFGGVAWGNQVLGWIGLGLPECNNCTVRASGSANRRPTVQNITIQTSPAQWCADTPFYRVLWDYTDPDGDIQARAQVRFTNTADPTNVLTITSVGFDQFYRFDDPLGYKTTGAYDGTGYFRTSSQYSLEVRASDGPNSWSSWNNSGLLVNTPQFYPPFVDFSWTASSTGIGTSYSAAFQDKTIDRSLGQSTQANWSWLWDFVNAVPAQSALQNPTTIYNSLPNDVQLTLTDPASGSCLLTQTVSSSGGPTPGTPKRRGFKEL